MCYSFRKNGRARRLGEDMLWQLALRRIAATGLDSTTILFILLHPSFLALFTHVMTVWFSLSADVFGGSEGRKEAPKSCGESCVRLQVGLHQSVHVQAFTVLHM